MLYNLISTPFSLAYSTILLFGLILKPIIIAFEAAAKTISLSDIAPILLLITLTLIPSTSSFCKEFLTASSLPLTSALRTTLISFVYLLQCLMMDLKFYHPIYHIYILSF